MSSPYAPHTAEETDEMLDEIGVGSVDGLFDIPSGVRFDGDFGIEPSGERETRREVEESLSKNDDIVEFLGRGHYAHYVPSVVDHLSLRSEFLTSYTQYQPEVAQGFLQALFEYQSLLVELTGLRTANASMYDHATALGEAALLSARVEDGTRVLVPENVFDDRKSVLVNYVEGAGLEVEEYGTTGGNVDTDSLEDAAAADVVMVYVESPNSRGAIEENVEEVAGIARRNDAVACLGSDPVALSVLEKPSESGIDVVVGGSGALGLPASYGTGLGMFAARRDYLRSTPGRLVGASEDDDGRRAYTLTLQTREQHIRKERATSNICTNQAWVALRTAIHAAYLGPSGLVELAERCVELPRRAAEMLDSVDGVEAPADDVHHFREFVARVDDAPAVVSRLEDEGYAVHAVGDDEVQVCVTEVNADELDGLVAAFEEVVE